MKHFTVFGICIAIFLSLSTSLKAQTAGTLTFSVTTTEPVGGYSNVNVIALWIEDTNGYFIKTKIRYADSRIQFLDRWISTSDYNVTDAVTGPTRASHGPLTFAWNATDTAGSVIADQDCKVWIQMSDRNLSGPATFVRFSKDTSVQSFTVPDTGNFTNMSLSWNPVIGIDERDKQLLSFACEPNPIHELGVIRYQLDRFSDVTITLHDIYGKLTAVIFDGNQNAGEHRTTIKPNDYQLSSGIYYLKINTGKITDSRKIIFTP